MNSKLYHELLRDPRWIARREAIKKLDGNKCARCGDDQDLVVHHVAYIEGAMPWQYDARFLVTLCEPCHSSWQWRKETMDFQQREFFGMLPLNHRIFSIIGKPSREECGIVSIAEVMDGCIQKLGEENERALRGEYT